MIAEELDVRREGQKGRVTAPLLPRVTGEMVIQLIAVASTGEGETEVGARREKSVVTAGLCC